MCYIYTVCVVPSFISKHLHGMLPAKPNLIFPEFMYEKCINGLLNIISKAHKNIDLAKMLVNQTNTHA